MFQVYIIYSSSANKFYKGLTKHLDNSIRRHNNGLEMATKQAIPWILLWSTDKESFPEAVSLVRKLINLTTNRIIKFMLSHKEEISGSDAFELINKKAKRTQG